MQNVQNSAWHVRQRVSGMICDPGGGISERICRAGAGGVNLHELLFKGLLILAGKDGGGGGGGGLSLWYLEGRIALIKQGPQ